MRTLESLHAFQIKDRKSQRWPKRLNDFLWGSGLELNQKVQKHNLEEPRVSFSSRKHPQYVPKAGTKKHIQRSVEPLWQGTIYPCFPQGKIWKESTEIEHPGKRVPHLPCHIMSVALATIFLLGIGKFTMFFMQPVINARTSHQPRSSSLAVSTLGTIRTLLRKCSPKLRFWKP